MLNKRKELNTRGFTIIEVMIVLAIAGLIILIVLLAVPNLQRNGRNTAIKSDAGSLSAGMNEFASNNDGAPPTSVTGPAADGTVTITGVSGTPTKIKIQSGTTVLDKGNSDPSAADPNAAGTIWVYHQYNCSGTSSKRANCVVYDIETAGGLSVKRVDG